MVENLKVHFFQGIFFFTRFKCSPRLSNAPNSARSTSVMQNLAEKILFLRGLNSEKFECSQLVQNLSATNLFKVSLFKAHLVLSNAPGDSPPPDLSKGQISNPCYWVRLPTQPILNKNKDLSSPCSTKCRLSLKDAIVPTFTFSQALLSHKSHYSGFAKSFSAVFL